MHYFCTKFYYFLKGGLQPLPFRPFFLFQTSGSLTTVVYVTKLTYASTNDQ